jgi:hypothetical protein
VTNCLSDGTALKKRKNKKRDKGIKYKQLERHICEEDCFETEQTQNLKEHFQHETKITTSKRR